MKKRVWAAMAMAGVLVGMTQISCAQERGAGLAPVQPNSPMTVDGYLGAVNGEPVFVDDIFLPIDEELVRLAKVSTSISEFKSLARETIAKQINIQTSDMLMIKAAKDGLSEEENKRIDAYMNVATKNLITQYGGSAAMADMKLRGRGSSLDKEIANKRREAIIGLYLEKDLKPKIVVTYKDVLREYERNKIAKYTVAADVDLYTITIPATRYLKEEDPEKPGEKRTIKNPTPAQVQEALNLAKERAKALIAQLRNGADFAKLAEENSVDPKRYQGGRWQHTKKGALARKEVEDVAFSLPANTIADPVVLPDKDVEQACVMIIKVGDVTPGGVIPFEVAQGTIDKALRLAQHVKLTNEYYAKLRERAAIEPSMDKMTEVAVEAAMTRYAVK